MGKLVGLEQGIVRHHGTGLKVALSGTLSSTRTPVTQKHDTSVVLRDSRVDLRHLGLPMR
jgi:hypothetical protein